MLSFNNYKVIIFSVNRISHHQDYAQFLKVLFKNTIIISNAFEQLQKIFDFKSIVFLLDVDYKQSLFLPLIIIRNFFGAKTITLGVSSERLKNVSLKSPKSTLGNYLFLTITKRLKNVKNVTIHPEDDNCISKYYTNFIKDFQYWDLQYLQIKKSLPIELNKIEKKLPIISLLGTFNEKRFKNEFVEFIKNSFDPLKYNLLIAGKIDIDTFEEIKHIKGLHLIPRVILNQELIFLYDFSDFILCCYNNINRPSGFFGRALQMNKFTIILEGEYLDINDYGYENIVKIQNFEDLNNFNFEKILLQIVNNSYSSKSEYKKLKRILFNWEKNN